MTAPRLRSILAVAAALSVAALLAGCTADAAPEPTTTAPGSPVVAPTPTATAEPSAAATSNSTATCASILPEDTVADFEEIGWSAQEEPFHVGGIEVQGGLQCKWGDPNLPSEPQIFGWAPITDEQASTAQDALLADGWRREDAADGIYVTESADTAIATDAEGYGITYFFGPGWVTIADTKQGLILVEAPES